MANEYLTITELKATLDMSGETYADADMTAAISTASRSIDSICNRRFYPDPDANQVRYFSPASMSLLYISDLITLTSFKSDSGGAQTYAETWTQNTDFVLEPINPKLYDGVLPEPWARVRLHPLSARWFPYQFPRSVQITGKFGWPAPPAEIKTATGIVASKLLRRVRDAPFGIVSAGIDQTAAMRVLATDPDVSVLVAPFMTRQLVA